MVKTFYLSNGLKVAMEYMTQYRSVSMGVWVKAGSVNENKQTNGMAHVIEHMLFTGRINSCKSYVSDRRYSGMGNR